MTTESPIRDNADLETRHGQPADKPGTDHVQKWIASLDPDTARMIVDQTVRALYLSEGKYDLDKQWRPGGMQALADYFSNMGKFCEAMARQQDQQEQDEDLDRIADALIEADWLIDTAGTKPHIDLAKSTAARRTRDLITKGCDAFNNLKAVLKLEREAYGNWREDNRQAWSTMVAQLENWADDLESPHGNAGIISGMREVAADIERTRAQQS